MKFVISSETRSRYVSSPSSYSSSERKSFQEYSVSSSIVTARTEARSPCFFTNAGSTTLLYSSSVTRISSIVSAVSDACFSSSIHSRVFPEYEGLFPSSSSLLPRRYSSFRRPVSFLDRVSKEWSSISSAALLRKPLTPGRSLSSRFDTASSVTSWASIISSPSAAPL